MNRKGFSITLAISKKNFNLITALLREIKNKLSISIYAFILYTYVEYGILYLYNVI